jgi:hypothetical protein
MNFRRIQELEERFKRGCDLGRAEIGELFAHLARIEAARQFAEFRGPLLTDRVCVERVVRSRRMEG